MSERSKPQLAPVGSSGVTMYGGVVYSTDRDKAWRGVERDRTIAAMLTDPLIGAILLTMEMYIRRVDWYVEAFDESAEATELATFVESCLDDMDGLWPGDTLADLLSYFAWGYSVSEIVYKQRIGPRETDPTKRSMYEDGRYGWRGWYLRPQTTRDGWVMNGDDAVAFRQRHGTTFATVEIPLDRCLYLRYQSGSGSPEGRSPLRHAYDAWYYRRQIQRIEAIGIERDLAGLPVMYIPSQDIENQTATYIAAVEIVTNIRNDAMAGGVLSSDRDQSGNKVQELTLLSTGGTRQFDTDAVIRRYSNELVTAFLAQVMRTGQDATGAYALSQTMSDMFVASLAAHLDIIQTAVNEQAVRRLLEVNGLDVRIAPTVKHGDIEAADIARIGAYLVQLSNAGLLEDTPALRVFLHELAGIPVPSEDEIEERMAEREAKAAEIAQQAAVQISANNANDGQQQQDGEDDAAQGGNDAAA